MTPWCRSLLAAVCLSFDGTQALALDGLVVDAQTGAPVAQATVRAGAVQTHSDDAGRFSVDAPAGPIIVRAPGYRRAELPASGHGAGVVRLLPVRPKALYLSVFGIGNAAIREAALKLVDETELNALVIDIKGDRGLVPYRSAAYAVAGIGPQTVVTVSDMPGLMRNLRDRGLYLIARIVVFKDDPLARSHPHWAVRSSQGAIWTDREGLAWIDPSHRAAWAHSLALAEEAARLGFDEVQFDYVRFPDAGGLSFNEPNTREHRVATIDAFLDAAGERLAPFGVFVAADIFGYVAWNSDDTQIGQQLETLARRVDYLSPMLYPSGFSFGIPGHRDPVAAPDAIVDETLRRLLQRTGLPGVRVRPWLQAFRDYAFDRRSFGAAEIRAQIDAADRNGTAGWMLWNPHNRYESGGLKPAARSQTMP